MKLIATLTLTVTLTASLAMAGSVQGEYIEARNADVYTGACFANSEGGIVGDLAVMGWKISKGTFQGVSLDGLGVVAVVKASGTLGDVHGNAYPAKAVLILDENASAEQRLALRAFAQKAGGDLLSDVVRVEYAPISLDVADNNIHSAKAKLTAGSLAAIQTRALMGTDHVCSNEEVWYLPLTKVEHFMPVFTMSHSFQGQGLDTRWNGADKRGSFLASFQLND
jgi:hypothetical protein